MADLLLKEADPTRYTPVGVNWVGNFVKRHKDLQSCFARKISYKQAECENPKDIKVFTSQNIQSSFAAAGIRPLNSQRVLDHCLPAPSTPKSGETLS